ncbi:AsmA family protein [Vibrio sp. TRT 1302]|uniref:AsmA family protein n=1 Tax=Vibrio sp. TRT 1302 TaxID=3418504 RepID=UPI003CF40AE2
MKKALLLLSILLVSIATLSILTLYIVMQSQYAPKAVNLLISKLTPYSITTSGVQYTAPFQLKLSDVEIQSSERVIMLPAVTLWLSQIPWQQNKLSFDSILIEGATINLEAMHAELIGSVYVHQLALKHVDISAPKWSARSVNLQIEQPRWVTSNQSLPYGDIQLSAEQLYMQGEALNNLLIDMRYQEENSTIFGGSFNWRGAVFSGQAEQYSQGWSLVNVTIDKLSLPESEQVEQLVTTLNNLSLPINHINSLDILSSSFNYGHWRFEQLDASLENLSLDDSLWQHQSGYVSFDAESISNQQVQLFSPRARLALAPQQVTIEEFDADFRQGRVQLQGTVSPKQVALKQLKIVGVKWLEQTEQAIPAFTEMVSNLRKLTIETLNVENSQFIQVEKRPYWQVSGLNVTGSQLSFIDENKAGLLSGDLEISANAASIDKLIATQAHVKAHAENNRVTLERAFIPLEQGYIEASGIWDRGSVSAPWSLSVHADGLPLDHYLLQQRMPFSLSGLAEAEVELKGLSGDYSMLSHSLSGHILTQLHQTQLDAVSLDGEKNYQQTLDLSEITLHADRGRMVIAGGNDNAQIAGEVDLTKLEFATLLLKAEQKCQELWSDVLGKANVIKQTCSDKEPPLPKAVDSHDFDLEAEPSTAL